VFSKLGFSVCFAMAFEGRFEMLVLDPVERRQVIGKRAFSEQWVGGHVGFFGGRIWG